VCAKVLEREPDTPNTPVLGFPKMHLAASESNLTPGQGSVILRATPPQLPRSPSLAPLGASAEAPAILASPSSRRLMVADPHPLSLRIDPGSSMDGGLGSSGSGALPGTSPKGGPEGPSLKVSLERMISLPKKVDPEKTADGIGGSANGIY
jgi:hypothetical protein